MDSLKSSLGAYNALHGGWYKGMMTIQLSIIMHILCSVHIHHVITIVIIFSIGKLVTAKYIPEAKYHKWFPVSVNSKTPILQS